MYEKRQEITLMEIEIQKAENGFIFIIRNKNTCEKRILVADCLAGLQLKINRELENEFREPQQGNLFP